MNTPKPYPTDLTQAQWEQLVPLLPKRKWRTGGPGRPPVDLHRVINGILYLLKTGCQWALLPRDFGCDKTVNAYFNTWRKDGTFKRIQQVLTRQERVRQGRLSTPSAGCLDSQSIKTATQGKSKGDDAGKKVNGRKRHLLVDTMGLITSVFVSSADWQDRDGLKEVMKRCPGPSKKHLQKVWVDEGYRGEALKTWLAEHYQIDLEVVERTGPGFQVVKRRWVVERTFAWLLNFRRLSKDYEVLTRSSEAFIHLAMSYLLLKRLA